MIRRLLKIIGLFGKKNIGLFCSSSSFEDEEDEDRCGVALVSRIDKMMGFFCTRAL